MIHGPAPASASLHGFAADCPTRDREPLFTSACWGGRQRTGSRCVEGFCRMVVPTAPLKPASSVRAPVSGSTEPLGMRGQCPFGSGALLDCRQPTCRGGRRPANESGPVPSSPFHTPRGAAIPAQGLRPRGRRFRPTSQCFRPRTARRGTLRSCPAQRPRFRPPRLPSLGRQRSGN